MRIPIVAFGKLMGGALGAAGVAGDVARHVAWYVSHHIHGPHR